MLCMTITISMSFLIDWFKYFSISIGLLLISAQSILAVSPELTVAITAVIVNSQVDNENTINFNVNSDPRTLLDAGLEQAKHNNYQEAISLYLTALENYLKRGDILFIAATYNHIGEAYYHLQEHPKALDFYHKSLQTIHQLPPEAIADLAKNKIEGRALNNIGAIYYTQGNYQQALDFYQQALPKRIYGRDLKGQEITLGNIANVYNEFGQYAQALDYHQRALKISREIRDRQGEGYILDNLGSTYTNLGEYPTALDFFRESLQIRTEIDDEFGQGVTLYNMGYAYEKYNNYQLAEEYYKKALEIQQDINDQIGQGYTLSSLGNVYLKNDRIEEALQVLEEALALFRKLDDRANEAITLIGFGDAYKKQGAYAESLVAYQNALATLKEIGNRPFERITLEKLGDLFQRKNQQELAIAFYKQSVNVTEAIRQNLRSLPPEQQESYTKTVADTYRALAALLLEQGRILEAQQVLELLKQQEVRDYTRDERAIVTEVDGQSKLEYTPIEQAILDKFGSLIAFSQQVNECERTNCPQEPQLNTQREALVNEYNQYTQQIIADIRQRRVTDEAAYDPRQLGQSARKIVEAQPGTLLIYPLVLPDKLWLLWVAPGGIANRIEVPVSQKELGVTATEFRMLLEDPGSDPAELQISGQKLYQWLIKPLEPELEKNAIQNLVFSLDRATRYLPMAALFDGQHYLIENYQIATILSAELTDMATPRPTHKADMPVLALGMSTGAAEFPALPNVISEIDNIVKTGANDPVGIYPGRQYLDRNFNFRALADNLRDFRVLHIATHGKFTPGLPSNSYLLLGTGEQLTIDRIQTLQNRNFLHLVVLSACETGLTGPDAEGLEIAGLGYYFSVADGAKAVMASLWRVNDSSTSEFMQRFYANLGNETQPITKAAALRQTQLSFLHPATTDQPSKHDFSHPYYWAPFFIIGNGL